MMSALSNTSQSKKQKAFALVQANRLEEAMKLYVKLCKQDKSDAEAWFMQGALHGRLGSYVEAEACFRQVTRLCPRHAEAYDKLGLVLCSQGKLSDGITNYRKAIGFKPDYAAAHFNLGNALKQQDKVDDAVSCYREAIKQRQDFVEAFSNLALLLEKQGNIDAALTCLQQALRVAPQHPELHHSTGIVLQELERPDEAEQHYRRAVQLAPNHVGAWRKLAAVQVLLDNNEDAIKSFRQVLSIEPDDMDVLMQLGDLCRVQENDVAAVSCYKKVIVQDAGNARAHSGLGYVLRFEGKLDEALEHMQRALEIQPDMPEAAAGAAMVLEHKGEHDAAYEYLRPFLSNEVVHSNIAVIFGLVSNKFGCENQAIALMEKMLNREEHPPAECKDLHFGLARLYSAKAQYDEAFKHYKQANEIVPYQEGMDMVTEYEGKMISAFTPDFLAGAPRATHESDLPVFIVGMPRSGTSLTEQILASHPQVFGADELIDMFDIAGSISSKTGSQVKYPESIMELDQEMVNEFSQRYLSHLKELSADARRVTDKMPANYWHLGLISMLLPEARVINCIREPMDNCLSCYIQDFGTRHLYSKDLYSLGAVYRIYQRLMRHWKEVLTIPIMDVHYEQLVEDQEGVSRAIVEFCGLDWDPRCLQFHTEERHIRTASYAQVRQPIYKKSVGRWKNYEAHLGPLIEALNETEQ